MITYSVFPTNLGWMGVVQGEEGLKRILLPSPRSQDVVTSIAAQFPDSSRDDRALRPLTKMLASYYQGNRFSVDIPLDWSGSTSFCRTVWRAAQSIPWGEVRTYQWLGLYLRKPRALRAVGSALGKNPFPLVVPCHRVIRSDGTLGGFSAPTGIRLKRSLLELEGIRFDKQGKVIGEAKSQGVCHESGRN